MEGHRPAPCHTKEEEGGGGKELHTHNVLLDRMQYTFNNGGGKKRGETATLAVLRVERAIPFYLYVYPMHVYDSITHFAQILMPLYYRKI